jgi:hypothetical protein
MSLITRVILLSVCFGIMSCLFSAGDISNEIIEQSANGRGKKAIVFEKFGGATVNNSIQVAVLDKQSELEDNDIGNVFVCDEDAQTVGLNSVKIKWLNENKLEIQYKKSLRVFRKIGKIDEVIIVYKAE